MKNKKPSQSSADDVRRLAEARLKRQPRRHPSKADAPQSPADTQRLLHELNVHQIELEMQNEELQESRNRMELLLEKYTDLYDFAPVGHFSLDAQGRILEVNLAGAAMLGVERSLLVNQRFQRYVLPASLRTYQAFLTRIFAQSGQQVCEAALVRPDATPFWSSLHATPAVALSGPRDWCRVSVSNITSLKQAEEAQRRLVVLDASNRELEREISRRKRVEASLLRSQQHSRELLEASRRAHDHARLLSRRILTVQEEERMRISREMHDVIAPWLVAINVHLASLTLADGAGAKDFRKQIAQTQRLARQSVEVVQQFGHKLRPPMLDDLGLIPALRAHLNGIAKQTGLRVTLKASAQVQALSGARRTALYRIAQEAISNVARHAKAGRVDVHIENGQNHIRMRITDDGTPFDVAQAQKAGTRRHLGLDGMRERAELVGGQFTVESAAGAGTTIAVQMPLRQARRTPGARSHE